MVVVAGGRFRPPGAEADVEVQPFLMDKFEVTNDRFNALLNSDSRMNKFFGRYYDKSNEKLGRPKQPRTFVAPAYARQFAEWAGKQLPNETQWCFAAHWDAKAAVYRQYPWGERWEDAGFRRAFGPPEVDQYPKDVSPHGVRGMGGGVREICEFDNREAGKVAVRGGNTMLVRRKGRMLKSRTMTSKALLDHIAAQDVGFRCIMPLRRN